MIEIVGIEGSSEYRSAFMVKNPLEIVWFGQGDLKVQSNPMDHLG